MNDCIEEILESFFSLLNPSIVNFLKAWKQKLREYRAPTKHITGSWGRGLSLAICCNSSASPPGIHCGSFNYT